MFLADQNKEVDQPDSTIDSENSSNDNTNSKKEDEILNPFNCDKEADQPDSTIDSENSSNDNTNSKKEDEILNPFHCDKEADDCIDIRTKDGETVLVSYPMLVYMSDKFENLIKGDADTEQTGKRRFIVAIEFTTECIIKSISFHFPRFDSCQSKFSDPNYLRQLLTICREWSLTVFKKDLECHIMKVLKPILEFKNLTAGQLTLLQLADKFELADVVNTVLSNVKGVSFKYTDVPGSEFEKLGKDVKYEILKMVCMAMEERPTLFTPGKSTNQSLKEIRLEDYTCTKDDPTAKTTEPSVTELKSIFNFLDFIVYEDRVVDLCPKNKFKSSSRNDYTDDSSVIKNFSTRRTPADVKLVMSDGELFINPYILTSNSPVFEKMLSDVKKSVDEDASVLTMQWKSVKEIGMILKYLTTRQSITDDMNLETLASLCQEYRIDWLLKKIEEFIEEKTVSFSPISTEKLLKYLKIASIYGFEKAMEKIVQKVDKSFITLQMYEEFTWLNTSVKILLARKRLWEILPKDERDIIMNTNEITMLSVLADFKQEKFSFEKPFDNSASLSNRTTPLEIKKSKSKKKSKTGNFRATTSSSGGEMFGATTSGSGSGLFGASTSGSGGGLFGTTTSSSGGGLFGTSTSSSGGGLFGATTSGSGGGLFGTTTSGSGGGLFGTTTTTSSGGGLFGTTRTSSGSGLFGASTSGSGGGLFGATTSGSGGGLFGTSTSSSGVGLFGTKTTGSVGGMFGTTTTSSGGGLFGAKTPGSGGGLFGTSTSSSGGGLFTTTTTSSGGGLFVAKTSSSGGGLFGSST
ncbi:uncharacterized protein [Clytia hemisphaerica]|uniref:BTB domain-containing protein n=1 Tax=Clytia hemisphaerica TaxID=252671 RepID=A0A7M5UEW8_9CNID